MSKICKDGGPQFCTAPRGLWWSKRATVQSPQCKTNAFMKEYVFIILPGRSYSKLNNVVECHVIKTTDEVKSIQVATVWIWGPTDVKALCLHKLLLIIQTFYKCFQFAQDTFSHVASTRSDSTIDSMDQLFWQTNYATPEILQMKFCWTIIFFKLL
jgi:hypothetical protein